MLTRLQVNGFKNLVDVDVHFGPFTCIAGANGVGKSNLFDAIRFLSALADKSLLDAALSVRDEGGRSVDVAGIFHRVGEHSDQEMSFAAELIVPARGVDDLGQIANAAITFLRYELVLALRPTNQRGTLGPIEIKKEVLTHIPRGQAHARLHFRHSPRAWRRSAITGRRTAPAFISTATEDSGVVIKVHADSGTKSGGRPLSRAATNLPRTVLSVSNAAESPTALLAKKEMQAWRLLQLEPSSLRKPDEFTAPTRLGSDGSHLPATLFQLARLSPQSANTGNPEGEPKVYAAIANRLSSLIRDVRAVRVDRDERRELLTLEVTDASGTTHPARFLSDGTLRFLALSVLELEPDAFGLICLEEPENGIHPERIPAMLDLLQAIATDPNESIGPENPLRQVIVNTHSPAVVGHVLDDALLVAVVEEAVGNGRRFPRVVFKPLPDTWRDKIGGGPKPVARGLLLSYLNPLGETFNEPPKSGAKARRVMDRNDLQITLPFATASG